MSEERVAETTANGRGFRWPVSASATMAAPAGDLWKAISMPGNLELCHPFCQKNPVLAWPGAESRDEVHYLNGLVFERWFRHWDEGAGYDLQIGKRGGPASFVSWRITPEGRESSTLRITVFPYVLQQVPVVVRWAPHLLRLRPLLRSYLFSVVRGFDWYLGRGEAVPRNQWGRHPWFS